MTKKLLFSIAVAVLRVFSSLSPDLRHPHLLASSSLSHEAAPFTTVLRQTSVPCSSQHSRPPAPEEHGLFTHWSPHSLTWFESRRALMLPPRSPAQWPIQNMLRWKIPATVTCKRWITIFTYEHQPVGHPPSWQSILDSSHTTQQLSAPQLKVCQPAAIPCNGAHDLAWDRTREKQQPFLTPNLPAVQLCKAQLALREALCEVAAITAACLAHLHNFKLPWPECISTNKYSIPLPNPSIFTQLLKSKPTPAFEFSSWSSTDLKQKCTVCDCTLLQNKQNIWHLSHSYVTQKGRTNSCVSACFIPALPTRPYASWGQRNVLWANACQQTIFPALNLTEISSTSTELSCAVLGMHSLPFLLKNSGLIPLVQHEALAAAPQRITESWRL